MRRNGGACGMVINTEELRDEMEARGVSFDTTNDSEVIARLIADLPPGNPVRAYGELRLAEPLDRGTFHCAGNCRLRHCCHHFRINEARRDGEAGRAPAARWLRSDLRPDRRYVQAALDDLHYLPRRNTHGLSFVIRPGERSRATWTPVKEIVDAPAAAANSASTRWRRR